MLCYCFEIPNIWKYALKKYSKITVTKEKNVYVHVLLLKINVNLTSVKSITACADEMSWNEKKNTLSIWIY